MSSEATTFSLEFSRSNWKFHHQSTSYKEKITEFDLKIVSLFPLANDDCSGEKKIIEKSKEVKKFKKCHKVRQ